LNANIKTARSPRFTNKKGIPGDTQQCVVLARRDAGYYWVKNQFGWQVAQYQHWDLADSCGGNWFLVGDDDLYDDVNLLEIGDKVVCPYA